MRSCSVIFGCFGHPSPSVSEGSGRTSNAGSPELGVGQAPSSAGPQATAAGGGDRNDLSRPSSPQFADRVYSERQHLSAARLQNAFRNWQEARKVKAENFISQSNLQSGVTVIKIKADAEGFKRVHMEDLNTIKGLKELHYVRLAGHIFTGHILHKSSFFDEGPSVGNPKLQSYGAYAVDHLLNGNGLVAYTPSGYFNNFCRADGTLPQHTPIGAVVTSETSRQEQESLRVIDVPADYRPYYQTISFKDGSCYTGGPVLARDGEATFTDDMLNQERFRYQGETPIPGDLTHAQHPNSRSAVSYPESPGKGRDYRLAVCVMTKPGRGESDTGMTMAEWSRVMARLSRLNTDENAKLTSETRKGLALNNDGGTNSVLGVVSHELPTTLSTIFNVLEMKMRYSQNIVSVVNNPDFTDGEIPNASTILSFSSEGGPDQLSFRDVDEQRRSDEETTRPETQTTEGESRGLSASEGSEPV